MVRKLVCGIAVVIGSIAPAAAQLNPEQMEWGPPPDGLPEGALFAVLSGDPTKAGLFTIRLRMPPGYRILPHRHTGDELVTVTSGEVSLGRGRSFSERKSTKLVRNGYSAEPANTDHYAFSEKGGEIQITGQGPFSIAYVRPRDDPRRKRR